MKQSSYDTDANWSLSFFFTAERSTTGINLQGSERTGNQSVQTATEEPLIGAHHHDDLSMQLSSGTSSSDCTNTISNVVDDITPTAEFPPCQPSNCKFPTTILSGKARSFNPSWYSQYSWLEYSVKKKCSILLCLSPFWLFKYWQQSA